MCLRKSKFWKISGLRGGEWFWNGRGWWFIGMRTCLNATTSLRFMQLIGLKFSLEGWSILADGLEQNSSLYKIAINRCWLLPEYVKVISAALGRHPLIETIDFSANGIEDNAGAYLVGIIQKQAERRDRDIWIRTLRKPKMRRITGIKLPKQGSEESIKKMNPFHGFGLTKLILKKNFLGRFFMSNFLSALNYDEYMRYVDLSDNKIRAPMCKDLIKGLTLHKNIVHLDLRQNPWYKDTLQAQLAIRLVKNIEVVLRRKQIMKKSWIDPELMKVNAPEHFHELIKERFNVHTNDSLQEAKFDIFGSPIKENFRSYSENTKKKRKKVLKEWVEDYGTNTNSLTSSLKKSRSCEKKSTMKTRSSSQVKFIRVNSDDQFGGSLKRKSKVMDGAERDTQGDSISPTTSVTRYLSPGRKGRTSKKSKKIKAFAYANLSQNIGQEAKIERYICKKLYRHMGSEGNIISIGSDRNLRFEINQKPKRKSRSKQSLRKDSAKRSKKDYG